MTQKDIMSPTIEDPKGRLEIRAGLENEYSDVLTAEALSALFDFNHAPFFQSFMKVQVQPSRQVVRLLLYGVSGLLPWNALEIGGQVIPPGDSASDPVVFEIPMPAPRKQPSTSAVR